MAAKIILVVDDEKEVLDWLEKRLSSETYVVLMALTAEEALEKARRHKPDLILMDIVLPDMEGSEVVRILAGDSSTAHIPVIFMSGIVSKEDEHAQIELNVGGRLYRAVSKPFEFEELLKEIQEIRL
ncbi:MAG: response regulator [Candidatus Omnitrophica bacterium]|nr:response regulator [Candidatus Omnitrophota bacterium]MBI5023458.1 response regulator [Candidatus Omnitrophota bacterium]